MSKQITPSAATVQQSLRDAFLAADDFKSENVVIDGRSFEVRTIDALAYSEMIERSVDEKTDKIDQTRLTINQVIATVFDPESGDRVFSYEDCPALQRKHGRYHAALAYLQKKAVAINRWGALEEFEKN